MAQVSGEKIHVDCRQRSQYNRLIEVFVVVIIIQTLLGEDYTTME